MVKMKKMCAGKSILMTRGLMNRVSSFVKYSVKTTFKLPDELYDYRVSGFEMIAYYRRLAREIFSKYNTHFNTKALWREGMRCYCVPKQISRQTEMVKYMIRINRMKPLPRSLTVTQINTLFANVGLVCKAMKTRAWLKNYEDNDLTEFNALSLLSKYPFANTFHQRRGDAVRGVWRV